MAQVPEQTLAWLYSRLQEYHDPQRAYTDVARAIAAFPSLPPRTDAYTYEGGQSVLLVNLHGTIPANFRGTTYRFPIKLWVPQTYPQESPIVYVQPSKDMIVRPGQHVGVDGRIYHPYLRDWAGMWDRASIAEFLGYLQQIFAKETPVISRAQQQQFQRPLGASPQPPPPVGGPPQLPPKPGRANVGSPGPSGAPAPPPRPVKPGEEYAEPVRDTNRNGPPLPPLPPQLNQGSASNARPPYAPPFTQTQYQQGPSYQPAVPAYQAGRSSIPPAGPATPQRPPSYLHAPSPNQSGGPVSPISPMHGYSELPENRYARGAPVQSPQYQQHGPPPPAAQPLYNQPGPNGHPNPQQWTARASGLPAQPQSQHPGAYRPAPQQPKQPAVDLLSSPFDITLPTQSSTSPAAAPPIPPNPEKEHLLHALSQTLVQQAHQKVSQNLSALGPLQAQQAALTTACTNLATELRQLDHLSAALVSNEAILRRSILECDQVIATATAQKSAKAPAPSDAGSTTTAGSSAANASGLPPIDDLLIAPTVVGQQLWRLCAEEAAAREAMHVLQRGLDRGRVSADVFAKQMRALGRECFLKMALAQKCARGMGLEVTTGAAGRAGGGAMG